MNMKKLIAAISSVALFIFLGLSGLFFSNGLSAQNMSTSSVECNCGAIWGEGCSAANYGNSCSPNDAEWCDDYDANCC